MVLDGARTDAELASDVLVGQAARGQGQNLVFARGQLTETLADVVLGGRLLAPPPILGEGILDALQQTLGAGGLFEEVDRSALDGAHRGRHIAEGREKDDRQQGAALQQLALQVQSRHVRHTLIEHQTAALLGREGCEKVGRRGEAADTVAGQFQDQRQ